MYQEEYVQRSLYNMFAPGWLDRLQGYTRHPFDCDHTKQHFKVGSKQWRCMDCGTQIGDSQLSQGNYTVGVDTGSGNDRSAISALKEEKNEDNGISATCTCCVHDKY